MLKNLEEIVNLDLSQLKIGTGPQIMKRKRLKGDGQNNLVIS